MRDAAERLVALMDDGEVTTGDLEDAVLAVGAASDSHLVREQVSAVMAILVGDQRQALISTTNVLSVLAAIGAAAEAVA